MDNNEIKNSGYKIDISLFRKGRALTNLEKTGEIQI